MYGRLQQSPYSVNAQRFYMYNVNNYKASGFLGVIRIRIFIYYSFMHSGYFYSASSSPLLLRSAPNAAWIRCRSFTLKRHRQQQVKDLPKVPTWRLAGFEPMTLRSNGIDSTNAPPRPTK